MRSPPAFKLLLNFYSKDFPISMRSPPGFKLLLNFYSKDFPISMRSPPGFKSFLAYSEITLEFSFCILEYTLIQDNKNVITKK